MYLFPYDDDTWRMKVTNTTAYAGGGGGKATARSLINK